MELASTPLPPLCFAAGDAQMIAVIMQHASASARSMPDDRRRAGGAAWRGARPVRVLVLLAMLPLACSTARAAEAVAAATARPATTGARFDDRFPRAQDNFADRFILPQPAPALDPPPKRVVTTIERFPRRGTDARRPSPPVIAPPASVRAY
ncbi:hypothetical protein [Rhodopseudomonas telluris]|uniref:Uncharacterized protein n=1 Tax=Rhodopseudomonas telluris TaxID=644215 RepID=A0ABV6EZT1_9BRAD